MNRRRLLTILTDVRDGRLGVEEAAEVFKTLPFEDLGFAKVDHHRSLRRGFPEMVLCQGKTAAQVLAIARAIGERGNPVIATRCGADVYDAVKDRLEGARYFPEARILFVPRGERQRPREKIAVVTAGTADLPVAEEAAVTAECLGVTAERFYDLGVAGLHRLLACLPALGETAVIVCVAGMEGALPGIVAGLVDRPVIAVPTSVGYGTGLGGLAALLTMLNSCSGGVGVVNIDNGFGAAYLAVLIVEQMERARRGGKDDDA
ncbi:MAG TPA: nickel pincer cofactor biosynthesis protein LarB [Syntrophales bacterium]|nr:nickel pincer cofactor biosynthesis protein LarB [Syntrophales bacterium]HOM07998.1 nickel pincer cofactor biosynthesis protein LarB [Syntrophales bacterium]HPC01878.1 nickel pincer cofactor biosynthesis protein LarB [Syntrophales bacterium]HRS87851.1 nickel pincer cofactor biosynthesis protein LarB [Syntrophales bacterium]